MKTWFVNVGFGALIGIVILQFPLFAQVKDRCMEPLKTSTSYDALRQGTSFDLYLKFHSPRCFLPVPHAYDPPPNISLQLTHDPRLHFEQYGHSFMPLEPVNVDRTPPIYGSEKLELFFHVSAQTDTPPGEYQFPAKLTYETIDAKGRLTTRTFQTVFCLKVVDTNAQVVAHNTEKKWNPANILLIPPRALLEIIKIITGTEWADD